LQTYSQSPWLRIRFADTASSCVVYKPPTLKPFAKPLWGSVRLWVQWHAKVYWNLLSSILTFWCLSILF
jgi:hypothetical protein